MIASLVLFAVLLSITWLGACLLIDGFCLATRKGASITEIVGGGVMSGLGGALLMIVVPAAV